MGDEGELTRSHTEGAPHGATSAWQSMGVLDLMQEGLQIIGFDWRYLYLNRAAAEHGRYPTEELIGYSMLERFPGIEHTPLFTALQRCMNERTPQCFDNEFTFSDGQRRWFELRIEPVPEGVLVLSIDITLRRELQANHALSQKMDALGRLAGGVAHDFNNILTVIVHSSEFVARALSPEDPSQADLREILHVADRGARLLRQLLAFSGRQPRDARPVAVNEALSELLPIVRRLVSDAVRIEFAADAHHPAVRIDQNHLTQVMINLVSNARDAIADRGTITISSAVIHAEEARALLQLEQSTGEYVRIAVRDNGCGMDEATRTHMFDPFFTTKALGKATGLGLAAVHGIVKQNDGEIRVLSVAQQGTTIELYFPRVATESGSRDAGCELTSVSGGTEVVLVVDDEASIRVLCARVLVRLGYTVMQAESPAEALRLVSRYTGPIDLVLSDVAMPEMSGVLLCQQLMAARPELRYLLMSGYVDSEQHPNLDVAQVLAKPFTQADLARRVRAVLDA